MSNFVGWPAAIPAVTGVSASGLSLNSFEGVNSAIDTARSTLLDAGWTELEGTHAGAVLQILGMVITSTIVFSLILQMEGKWFRCFIVPDEDDPTGTFFGGLPIIGVPCTALTGSLAEYNQNIANLAEKISAHTAFDAALTQPSVDGASVAKITLTAKLPGPAYNVWPIVAPGHSAYLETPTIGGGWQLESQAANGKSTVQLQMYMGILLTMYWRAVLNGNECPAFPITNTSGFHLVTTAYSAHIFNSADSPAPGPHGSSISLAGGGPQYLVCAPQVPEQITHDYCAFTVAGLRNGDGTFWFSDAISGANGQVCWNDEYLTFPLTSGERGGIAFYVPFVGQTDEDLQTNLGRSMMFPAIVAFATEHFGEQRLRGYAWNMMVRTERSELDSQAFMGGKNWMALGRDGHNTLYLAMN